MFTSQILQFKKIKNKKINEFKNLHWVKKLKRNMYADGHRYEAMYADKHGNEL